LKYWQYLWLDRVYYYRYCVDVCESRKNREYAANTNACAGKQERGTRVVSEGLRARGVYRNSEGPYGEGASHRREGLISNRSDNFLNAEHNEPRCRRREFRSVSVLPSGGSYQAIRRRRTQHTLFRCVRKTQWCTNCTSYNVSVLYIFNECQKSYKYAT